jgi:farnesyl-diphosphate farnesyltransferase
MTLTKHFWPFVFRKKQGAYGKIQTHKESKWEQLSHLDEVWAALVLLYINPMQSNLDSDYCNKTFHPGNLAFCDEILGKVSRSFAAVIRQLPPVLFVDIMIFYLYLRALDTIEDDMKAFENNDVKINHLLSMEKTALGNPSWSMDGVGEGDERRLLQEFPKCFSVYASLRDESKSIIADITKRMAAGMAEFVGKDLGQGTENIEQYNRYCHFVAGLVGEGLSKLFSVSGLENASMAKELHLSNQMGLFLQKTNIIRDYLEDYVEGRAFWPQTVWKKYSKDGDLGYFSKDENRVEALQCLNELITDALELVPDCLAYLSKLHCVEVFRFCAIPQVMAIATLDKCYHNGNVFTGVVKIRKGLSCKLINASDDAQKVHIIFYDFARSIARKAKHAKKSGFVDPSFNRTIKACDDIVGLTSEAAYAVRYMNAIINLLTVCTAISWYLAIKSLLIVFGVLLGFLMYMTIMTDMVEGQELKSAISIFQSNKLKKKKKD